MLALRRLPAGRCRSFGFGLWPGELCQIRRGDFVFIAVRSSMNQTDSEIGLIAGFVCDGSYGKRCGDCLFVRAWTVKGFEHHLLPGDAV